MRKPFNLASVALLAAAGLLAGCVTVKEVSFLPGTSELASAVTDAKRPALLQPAGSLRSQPGKMGPTLKDAYKNYFLVGVAFNQRQIDDEDPRRDPIIKAQ